MDHKRETETANLKRRKPCKPQSDIGPPARIHILSLPKHPPTGDQGVKCPNYRELAFKLLQRVGAGSKEVLTKTHVCTKYLSTGCLENTQKWTSEAKEEALKAASIEPGKSAEKYISYFQHQAKLRERKAFYYSKHMYISK